jgi:hypothetical protein
LFYNGELYESGHMEAELHVARYLRRSSLP